MANEHELRTTEKTPLEMAVETLFKYTPETGESKANSGFVLRRMKVINGNRKSKQEDVAIEAKRTLREDGRFEEAVFVFDSLGLRSESYTVLTTLSDIFGISQKMLTERKERSECATPDDQKAFSRRIVPFVANLGKMLSGQLEAVQTDGGNHQEPGNI